MKRIIVLCLLAVGLTVSHAQANDVARVSSVSGRVTYSLPNAGGPSPLTAGAEIQIGSPIRTGPDSSAVVVVVSGAAMQISENSDVTIDALSSTPAKRKALVSLKNGTVSALIDPKRSKQTDFK